MSTANGGTVEAMPAPPLEKLPDGIVRFLAGALSKVFNADLVKDVLVQTAKEQRFAPIDEDVMLAMTHAKSLVGKGKPGPKAGTKRQAGAAADGSEPPAKKDKRTGRISTYSIFVTKVMDAVKSDPDNPLYHQMDADGKPQNKMSIASGLWARLDEQHKEAFNKAYQPLASILTEDKLAGTKDSRELIERIKELETTIDLPAMNLGVPGLDHAASVSGHAPKEKVGKPAAAVASAAATAAADSSEEEESEEESEEVPTTPAHKVMSPVSKPVPAAIAHKMKAEAKKEKAKKKEAAVPTEVVGSGKKRKLEAVEAGPEKRAKVKGKEAKPEPPKPTPAPPPAQVESEESSDESSESDD